MRAHFFQHEHFEDPAAIRDWLEQNDFSITATKFYEKYRKPVLDNVDWLIIMGGPMGVYDEAKYPWLKDEKKWIAEAIQKNKVVLGICLGAQLIASALDAKVYPNKLKEIGWFPVYKTEAAKKQPLFKDFPQEITVFHWHGDTFDLPVGAVHLAESEGCKNQAFLYKNKVLGLQFHLEATEKLVADLIDNCRNELVSQKYIQNIHQLKAGQELYIPKIRKKLFGILDRLKTLQ